MGHTTDELLEMASAISDSPSPRELDMLMSTGEQVSIALMTMALHKLGIDAVSMTGAQMGMRTCPTHTRAKIMGVDSDRFAREFRRGRVVVAAGFQGVTEEGEITTLGRGGSDTTAVALAAALGVGVARPGELPTGETPDARGSESGGACEIYTDVDGVYTADPRIVKNARKLNRISYEEMLELASQGAAVMHARSVQAGQKYDVPIHVRHSSKPDAGTIICRETDDMEEILVAGCALKKDLGRISLRRIPNNPGVQGMIFSLIGQANIVVDDIIQTTHGDSASLSFTVDHNDLADVKIAATKAIEQLGAGEVTVEVGLAKVSVAGVGMRSHSGVAATMFKALGDAGIHIHNITTSDIKISCIVPREHGERALQVVHDAFGLGDDPQSRSKAGTGSRREPKPVRLGS
jgi:aspartate kinase